MDVEYSKAVQELFPLLQAFSSTPQAAVMSVSINRMLIEWCWICTKFEETASNSSHVAHVSTGAVAMSLGERGSETLIHGQGKRARINHSQGQLQSTALDCFQKGDLD